MKETNTNEQLFDGLFREELGNASSPVPPGVWEGIASSVSGTSAAGVAGTAGKMALWMKAAVSVIAVTAISVTVYQLMPDKNIKPDTAKDAAVIENNKTENTISETTEQPEVLPEIKAPAVVKKADKNPESVKPFAKAPFNSPYSGGGLQFRTYNDEPNLKTIPESVQPETTSEEGKDYDKEYQLLESESDFVPDHKDPADNQIAAAGKDSSDIFVPNAVTPNGDGKNDTYLIRIVNEESVEIIIYDPLSNEILFRTKNKYQGWNCNLPNGDPAPAGNYIVKVIYKFRAKPEAEPIYTKLTILR